MERQLPNIEIAQQYLAQVNERLLVETEPYTNETKTWNIGTFYIHRGMGQKGVEYSIREVTNETGGYKVHGAEGMMSDQVCYYLQGFLQGHFETCELLGYELVDAVNEAPTQEGVATEEDLNLDGDKAEG
jgi:hypothetical protein